MNKTKQYEAGARSSAWKNHGPEWTRHVSAHNDNHKPPQGREPAARDHTQGMLRWWQWAGISKADLAVRRSHGTMIWHKNIPPDRLPLPWVRAENVRFANVYIRPARGYSWPLVFLDDVPMAAALAVTGRYNALLVETSKAGGCHLWLSCSRTLDETERHDAQRWLVEHVAADPASTSGEHLGRLAGFKNHKRDGEWVNLLATSVNRRTWDPVIVDMGNKRRRDRARSFSRTGPDRSPSGNDWAWVCARLEAGDNPDRVRERLAEKARVRRGKDAERYARLTLRKAVLHAMHSRTM